jgi:hypothetical protein
MQEELFRRVLGMYKMQKSTKGPVVICQTVTEKEAVEKKVKANGLDVIFQAITPDLCYVYLKPQQPKQERKG